MDDVQELYYIFPQLKEHIVVEKKVGQGTFSYVYSGYYRRDKKEKLALKYIIPTSSPSRTKQEIECLLNIGGKDNVIGVLSVLRNKSHILILMPFVEHAAFHDSFIFWGLTECREYIKNLLIALKRVHQCGIIHRDVKPSNFLYEKQKNMFALVDFGLAQTYEKKSENVFEYESTNAKSKAATDSTPVKHNLISLAKKSEGTKTPTVLHRNNTTSSLNTPKKLNSIINKNNNEVNSILNSSIGFDCDPGKKDLTLKNPNNNSSSPFTSTAKSTSISTSISSQLNENKNTPTNLLNKPYLTSSFQKYYSFQKFSYSSLADNKCTCFNMPFVCEICTTRTNKWAPRAGTAGFRAPEVLFRSTCQTPSVDIWSAGIIFLSILTGRYPFFKAIDDNMAIMQLISLFGAESVRKTALKYGESLVCSFDKSPMDLKELCVSLRKNVINSVNSEKYTKSSRQQGNVSNEPIIEFPDTAYDLLKKLLELDSDKRFTAEDALNHSFFKCS